jgi:hypothetical protein
VKNFKVLVDAEVKTSKRRASKAKRSKSRRAKRSA